MFSSPELYLGGAITMVSVRRSVSVNLSFKWLLLWNYWPRGDLVQIWSQALLGEGLTDFYKWWGPAPLRSQEGPQKGYFLDKFKKKSSSQEPAIQEP